MAISLITKADCMRVRGPEMARPLSLSLPLMSVRDIFMAGSKPNMIPVCTETKMVKSSTGKLNPISSARGTVSGTTTRAAAVPHLARISPNPPPSADSRTLSVSSWRRIRICPAPSAARTENSRWRAVARASSRLATFTQAISKTNPTAPSNTSSAGRMSPTILSFKEMMLALILPSMLG